VLGEKNVSDPFYIHGTDPEEQSRLQKLGALTNEPFIQFLEFTKTSTILDVGCGLGILTRQLAERASSGTVWGVERSAEQLARAAGDLPNLHFRQADAHELPFDDNTFDVVFCRFLLEHVSDPVQVLKEMRRVLRPGGQAFAMENDISLCTFDPDCPHWDTLWRQFMALQERHGGDPRIGKKLFRLMREAGFADIRLSIQPEVHCHGMPSFRVWLENLIQNVRPCEGQLISEGLATVVQIRDGKKDLENLITNESGSAYFYWTRASGCKV